MIDFQSVSDAHSIHHDSPHQLKPFSQYNRLTRAISLYSGPLHVPERVFIGLLDELHYHQAMGESV